MLQRLLHIICPFALACFGVAAHGGASVTVELEMPDSVAVDGVTVTYASGAMRHVSLVDSASVFTLPIDESGDIRMTLYPRSDAASGRAGRVVAVVPATAAGSRVRVSVVAGSAETYENWMANLPDGAYVAGLSLIGTHDSGAIGSFSPWAASRVNQTMSLRRQLDAGYRVLDLRMRYNPADGTYGIAHESRVFGDFNADGLAHIADWLASHPTEGVIIRTRNEGSVDGWGDGVRDYLLSGPLADRLICDFDPEMTVGDLRGRVLLISTDVYRGEPVGARVRWGDATPFGTQPFVTSRGERGMVCFTDRYKRNAYRSPARADKSADIRRVLDSAARRYADGDYCCWHWTWLNVAGLGLGSPAKSTDVYTKLVADYMDHLPADRYEPVGMVMCDWAGRSRQGTVRCAAAVIDNNFRASAAGSWPPRKY